MEESLNCSAPGLETSEMNSEVISKEEAILQEEAQLQKHVLVELRSKHKFQGIRNKVTKRFIFCSQVLGYIKECIQLQSLARSCCAYSLGYDGPENFRAKKLISQFYALGFLKKTQQWKIFNVIDQDNGCFRLCQRVFFKNISLVMKNVTLHRCSIEETHLQKYMMSSRQLESLVFQSCLIKDPKFSQTFTNYKVGTTKLQVINFEGCNVFGMGGPSDKYPKINTIIKGILGTLFCESLSIIIMTTRSVGPNPPEISLEELNLASYGVTVKKGSGVMVFNFDSYLIQP
ncbi:unnamed protein product [Moneuplotes crassus]|uniref:Uncharacterized protein n=1 Tax=Euplotes crassus TaxID=5936 RepID=A0AAD1XSQ9_EUPCR|nr:unnamed protein product [Moneuplotes crassus]